MNKKIQVFFSLNEFFSNDKKKSFLYIIHKEWKKCSINIDDALILKNIEMMNLDDYYEISNLYLNLFP